MTRKQLYPEDVILYHPRGLRLSHRLTNISLTLLIWGMAVWLLQSLLTLGAWYFQLYMAHDYLVVLRGWRVGAMYVGVGLVICVLLLCWARLQQWRFRGLERRLHREPLDNEQIAAWYGVEPEQRLRWLAQRRLRVDLRRPAPDGDVALVVNAGADPSQPASR